MGGSAPPPRQPGTSSLDPHSGKRNAELRTISRCCLRSPWTRYRTLQSGKPNSVPMLLGTKSEPHNKRLPYTPWERNDCLHTGTAAKRRQPDACIRENKKMGEGESSLSLSPFFMFSLCPWKTYFVLHASCGNNNHRSCKSLRKRESRGRCPLAQGTGAAEAPAQVSMHESSAGHAGNLKTGCAFTQPVH